MVGDREPPFIRDVDGPSLHANPLVRSPISMVLGAAAVLVASVIVFLLIGDRDRGPDEQTETPAVTTDTSTTGAEVEAAQGGSDTTDDDVDDDVDLSGPYIEATLDDRDFVLRGLVSSPALAADLLEAAEVAYSPFFRSELMVDERLEPAEWLAGSPSAIVLLPMITDGTIRIADEQVQVSGRAPTADGVARLEGALGQVTGLSVEAGEVAITDLAVPELVLDADDGQVVLRGRLPTDQIRIDLVEAASAAYGEANVDDQLSVDPGVYSSLWMYNGGPLLQAMSVFPDYELRVDGTAFSGFINGGVTFEPNSAEFTGGYADVLNVGVSVLTRDQSLLLVIEGHTDSLGPDEVNLELSQLRAEAVMQYFIDNGIAPERLTAVGKGEAEPAVANDTVEGRARNRRIQYVLTSQQ